MSLLGTPLLRERPAQASRPAPGAQASARPQPGRLFHALLQLPPAARFFPASPAGMRISAAAQMGTVGGCSPRVRRTTLAQHAHPLPRSVLQQTVRPQGRPAPGPSPPNPPGLDGRERPARVGWVLLRRPLRGPHLPPRCGGGAGAGSSRFPPVRPQSSRLRLFVRAAHLPTAAQTPPAATPWWPSARATRSPAPLRRARASSPREPPSIRSWLS